jgi:NNP family nitrate/nitrite transporter-like MFS transporter
MPNIENDLGLNHSEAGSLFLIIAVGYFVTLMGSGFVSRRITHRKTIILSTITLGLAYLATSLSKSVVGMSAGLLVVGMATGLYLPSGIATLTSLVSFQHWGKAIAVHELAPNLAFVLAPLVSEVLLQWFSWRAVLALVGMSSLSIGTAFALFGRGGDFPGEAPALRSLRLLCHQRDFWIMIVLFSLGIAGTMGIYAMLPLYLVSERGIDQAWTNSVVAVSRIVPLFMGLLSGWVADRFGTQQTIKYVLLLTGILTILLGIVPGWWVVIIVFLQPMLAVCFFPAALAALSSIGPASARNVVVSFTIPLSFLVGAGAIPTLIGLSGNAGSFALGIAFTGTVMTAGAALTRYLESSQQGQN